MTRIAYLSYSTAEYDGRTQRMARSAIEAGYDVVVYARWQKGLPFEERAAGYRIVRVPAIPELAIPGRRGNARRRVASARRRQAALEAAAAEAAAVEAAVAGRGSASAPRPPLSAAETTPPGRDGWIPDRLRGTPVGRPLRAIKSAVHGVRKGVGDPLLLFPLRPMGWGGRSRLSRRTGRHLARDVGGFLARARTATGPSGRAERCKNTPNINCSCPGSKRWDRGRRLPPL